ncbi:UNVERIFIED_ORG: hypothetical protein HNP28_003908 [Comamonas terrigena]
MHLIDAAGHVNNQFVHEDPATNRPPTEIDAAWLNTVQNELANAIAGMGIDLDKSDQQQLFKAIQKAIPGAATTEKAGVSELATVDEAKEGRRGDVVVTPEGLDAALGKVKGLPLFLNGWHDGSRAGLAALYSGMATPQDGIQLSALTHPHIVKGVLAGHVASCTEAEWQADAYKRGMWSRGTASLDDQGAPQGWVRGPDRNGAQEGSLPAQFWRGGADAKAGSIGKDTMRNIAGSLGNVITVGGATDGPFRYTPIGAGAVVGNGNGYGSFTFDASRALPAGHTGAEFAPWHVLGCYYTITSNGVMNDGALDAAGLSAELLLLKGRVEGLPRAFGAGWVRRNVMASRLKNVWYTNPSPTHAMIVTICTNDNTARGATSGFRIKSVDGIEHEISSFDDSAIQSREHVILPGESYKQMTWNEIFTWSETTYG